MTTTPYDVGLGRFIDQDKGEFIGKAALKAAAKETRHHGITCPTGEPLISGAVVIDGQRVGTVTAGAMSPYLKHGIGYALMNSAKHGPGAAILVGCNDGNMHKAKLAALPFYDEHAEIPRGKIVDIPQR